MPIEKLCLHCGKKFSMPPSQSNKRYCSKRCWYDSVELRETHTDKNAFTKSCSICGKERRFTSFHKDKNRQFCSKACADIGSGLRWSGNANPNWQGGQPSECVVCEAAFWKKPSSVQITCSPSCGYKYRKSCNWIDSECGYCGKKFLAQRFVIEKSMERGTGQVYCCKEHGNLGKSGENNPNWNGGIATEYPWEFKVVRKAILERDNYTCMQCGKNAATDAVILEVHHIDYKTINNDPSNLITLCKICHNDTKNLNGRRVDKERMIAYYTEKMNNRHYGRMEVAS
jgi:endogenous inhibitor of DNA gyrase (YacG/DUF329 family)